MKRAVGIICAMALCMSEMQSVLAEDLPVVETESECAEKEETAVGSVSADKIA